MQNKFLLLNPFFGLFIWKVFDQIKFFVTLFISLSIHYNSMGQECIDYPDIEGAPCIVCVPTGWTAINSPDIGSFGGGPSPCIDNIGVSGPSPSGGNFVSLCTNNAGYSEGMSRIINNLIPCQSYTFGIWWEETIWCNVWNNPGTLLITVQGEEFIFSGATTWELAQVCFTAQSTSVEISVRAFFNGAQHCLIVDGSPQCSELSACPAPEPCCSLIINVDQAHEICPGTSINLNAIAQNATGNIQVEWTSIPANGVNFLNDVNILNPIFTFPTGDFDGETFNFLLTVTDDLCTKTKEVDVTVLKSEVPTFDFNICELSDPSVFPTTSNNGYEGTWAGNFDFPSLAGTNATYIFTLASNEENCIRQANFDIEIIEAISVLLDLETTFCVDDNTVYNLPVTSQNLVDGRWDISEFSPATLGTGNFSFQFTPENQFCALPYSHNISIQLKPFFDTLICNTKEDKVLDPQSINGILGFFDPAVINPIDIINNEFTSIWNPLDPLSTCVTDLPITYTLQDIITLSFYLPDTLYLNSGVYNLPTTSLEGIRGQWNIPFIDTDLLQEGTINLKFSSPEFCVQDFQADIILKAKESSIAQCDFTITIPQDITICDPGDITLDGQINGDFLSFEWTSSSGYSNVNNLSPLVPVAFTTTFTLSATSVSSTNLIINGDFSMGNLGIISDYTFTPAQNPAGLPEGWYNINTMTPSLWNNCPSLDGNMMVVNGAPILNQNVWCQNVSVTPNTQYVFSTWLQTIILPVPQLSFTINGIQIGNVFSGSSSTCNWQQFFTTWDSGGASNALICITNENNVSGGNDFALDDIFFGPVCEDEKSFTVTVDPFVLDKPDDGLIDCNNPDIHLTVMPLPISNTYEYAWVDLVGNIVSGATEQSVTVNQGGIYEVTVTNNITGCTRKETFNVMEDISPPEIEIIGNLNIDCKNNTSLLSFISNLGIVNTIWTLPNGSMVQSASVNASTGGFYKVSVEATNGCTGIDSVLVKVDNSQIVYQPSTSGPFTCNVDTVLINLNLFSNVDSINWRGPGIVNQSNLGDTIIVNRLGTYFFQIYKGENCFVLDSIIVAQQSPLYQYQIELPDTISCTINNTWLRLQNIIGIDSVIWSKTDKVIGNGDSLLVDQAGKYYLQVIDPNGCKKTDSIFVFGDFESPVFSVEVDSIDCLSKFGQFNVNYTGLGTFDWVGPEVISNLKNPTFTREGNYRLIVTAINGCKDSLDVFLPSSIDFPKISENIVPITCANPNGSIQLSASIASTFTWNSNTINGSGSIITSNTGGLFDIIATSSKGCTSAIQLSIPVDTLKPLINPIQDILLTCKNPDHQLILDVSSYDVYAVSGPGLSNIPSILPTLTQKGVYTLNVKNNQNGCTNSTQFNVNEDNKKLKFAAVVPDLSCKNPSSSLSLSGDASLEFDIDGKKIANGYLISSAGKYIIKATNAAGCDTIITLDVKGNFDLPVISLSPILLNCNFPQQWIKDRGNESGLTYTWETENGSISKDSILITQNSNITLVATNTYGCVSKLKADINTDFAKPSITIDGPKSIPCKASSVTLTGTTNVTNTLWTWSDNNGNLGNEKTFKVNNIGTYTILVKNLTNGCTETETVTIDKQPAPEDFTIDLVQPLCFGDQGSLTWTGTTGGTAPYSLTFNNNALSQNKKTEISSGRFTLYLKDVNGCDLEKRIEIESPKDFLVNAGRDTIIQLSTSHQIKAISDVSWSEIKEIQWEPATALSCTDCPNPVATPEADTEYTITIKDKNGCIREDKVKIRVKSDKGWVAPNIFYPSSNTDNQRFTIYPQFASIQNIKTLKVYDRWGNMVFTTQNIPAGDINFGWDGLFDGREINPGVFIWVAEIEYKDKSSEIAKGDVTIMH